MCVFVLVCVCVEVCSFCGLQCFIAVSLALRRLGIVTVFEESSSRENPGGESERRRKQNKIIIIIDIIVRVI